jgi:hypothetical protein
MTLTATIDRLAPLASNPDPAPETEPETDDPARPGPSGPSEPDEPTEPDEPKAPAGPTSSLR